MHDKALCIKRWAILLVEGWHESKGQKRVTYALHQTYSTPRFDQNFARRNYSSPRISRISPDDRTHHTEELSRHSPTDTLLIFAIIRAGESLFTGVYEHTQFEPYQRVR